MIVLAVVRPLPVITGQQVAAPDTLIVLDFLGLNIDRLSITGTGIVHHNQYKVCLQYFLHAEWPVNNQIYKLMHVSIM